MQTEYELHCIRRQVLNATWHAHTVGIRFSFLGD